VHISASFGIRIIHGYDLAHNLDMKVAPYILRLNTDLKILRPLSRLRFFPSRYSLSRTVAGGSDARLEISSSLKAVRTSGEKTSSNPCTIWRSIT
jgi:hypothetical protein